LTLFIGSSGHLHACHFFEVRAMPGSVEDALADEHPLVGEERAKPSPTTVLGSLVK
jgi:hypothetical protein